MIQIIKETKVNIENLHYPFLILDNGEKIMVHTKYLITKYPTKENKIDLDLIGKEFDKGDYFKFMQNQARIELLPIVVEALKTEKKYSRLTLRDKGYYSILKEYDLIKELKELLK